MTAEVIAGHDYRLPAYRRVVFLDFYDFHLRYRSHPGGVYFLIPYLRDYYGWTDEELYWFCFLNGNTQNPITSWLMWRVAPAPRFGDKLVEWYNDHYTALAFDTDRRHHKPHLPQAIEGYRSLVGPDQRKFWADTARGGFSALWAAGSSIPYFGRLSTWSYMDYLHCAGVDVNCDTLMLDDMSGSKSHRNGIAKVTGHDEWDWHRSNPDFDGHYTPDMLKYLEYSANGLLQEAQGFASGKDYARDVNFLTLESAFCTYKSWYRSRRYPNVYMDMMHDRIRLAEKHWPETDFSVFWEARRASLPSHLLLEDRPGDPGVKPLKQGWFAQTGQVIMMEHEFPQYANDFAQGVQEERWGRFR